MYLKAALVLLVGLLVSCATRTQVQLYSEYLSEADIIAISKLLATEEYQIVLNDHPVPPGLKASTLIYSPLNRDIRRVNQLAEILGGTQWGLPNLELTGKENHFYTRRTVGLYLLPESVAKQRQNAKPKRYSQEYNGRCETMDVVLALNEDGSLTLTSFEWDPGLDRELQSSVPGEWVLVEEKIYLSLANQRPVEFAIKRRVVDGEKGYREYRLVNNTDTNFFDNCSFRYKELTY